MSQERIYETLAELLANILEVDEDQISPESDLKEDLDLDIEYDEDIFEEILLEFFDIETELSAEYFESAQTVADMVDLIERKLD